MHGYIRVLKNTTVMYDCMEAIFSNSYKQWILAHAILLQLPPRCSWKQIYSYSRESLQTLCPALFPVKPCQKIHSPLFTYFFVLFTKNHHSVNFTIIHWSSTIEICIIPLGLIMANFLLALRIYCKSFHSKFFVITSYPYSLCSSNILYSINTGREVNLTEDERSGE